MYTYNSSRNAKKNPLLFISFLDGIFTEMKDYWSALLLIGWKNPPSYLDLVIIHVTGLYFLKQYTFL